MLTQTIFYAFAALLLGSATLVITVRNPVHAALFLVLAFFSSAAIWLLLEAEFLAIALVLVYVGAVMVLFLFVVMMLDINTAPLREGFVRYLPLSVLVALLMIIAMGLVIGSGAFDTGDWRPVAAADFQNRQENGWTVDTSVRAGIQIDGVLLTRNLQFLLEYFNGHSPNGQFYKDRIEYFGIGTHFHF